MTLLSAGVVSEQLNRLWTQTHRRRTFVSAMLDRIYSLGGVVALAVLAMPLLVWLIGPGVWTRLSAGYVDLHWSRVVLAGLIAFGLMQMLVTVLIANVLRFHVARGSASSARRVTAVASTPAADLRSATSPAGSMIDAGVMIPSS